MGCGQCRFFREAEECFAFCFCHEVVDDGGEVIFECGNWGCCLCEVYAVDCCVLRWSAEESWWDLKGGHDDRFDEKLISRGVLSEVFVGWP